MFKEQILSNVDLIKEMTSHVLCAQCTARIPRIPFYLAHILKPTQHLYIVMLRRNQSSKLVGFEIKIGSHSPGVNN